jgi:hypothetical protein
MPARAAHLTAQDAKVLKVLRDYHLDTGNDVSLRYRRMEERELAVPVRSINGKLQVTRENNEVTEVKVTMVTRRTPFTARVFPAENFFVVGLEPIAGVPLGT